jgi:hypothetical protein
MPNWLTWLKELYTKTGVNLPSEAGT